jgi:hypothetical protein
MDLLQLAGTLWRGLPSQTRQTYARRTWELAGTV